MMKLLQAGAAGIQPTQEAAHAQPTQAAGGAAPLYTPLHVLEPAPPATSSAAAASGQSAQKRAPATGALSTLLPPHWGAEQQPQMPYHAGIGFIDVALIPGNSAARIPAQSMAKWRAHLYKRLQLHTAAARETECAADVQSNTAGAVQSCSIQAQCRLCAGAWQGKCSGAPAHVVFSGKRHFEALFSGSYKR